jgi:hypothetical protein
MFVSLRNWRTSILGFLSLMAKSGAATAPRWAPLLNPLGDALFAAGLMVAKDAATGSAP